MLRAPVFQKLPECDDNIEENAFFTESSVPECTREDAICCTIESSVPQCADNLIEDVICSFIAPSVPECVGNTVVFTLGALLTAAH